MKLPEGTSPAPNTTEPTGPEQIAGQCIAARLRLINRAVTAIYDRALRPLNLKLTQMNLLVAVGSVNRARPEDICRMLVLSRSTLSRNIKPLIERGLLVSETGRDGRVRILSLTRQGRELIRSAGPGWARAQQEAGELLGKDGVEAIGNMADRLWNRETG